jgi:hypothetical protein
LCNPFPPDSTFRRLKVQLIAPIDAQDPVSAEFRRHRLNLNQQTSITYDFLRAGSMAADEEAGEVDFADGFEADPVISSWRAKYFIHTIYGHWTSAECYSALQKQFVKRDYEKRASEIAEIAGSTPEDWERWASSFVQILSDVADQVDRPDRFLRFDGDRLDVVGYHRQFRNQIRRQVDRARDPWFCRSYISGFSFAELPAMRETSSIWREFLDSLGEALAFEVAKRGTRQLLARQLRERRIVAVGSDGSEVISAIDYGWAEHGRIIRAFYAWSQDASRSGF